MLVDLSNSELWDLLRDGTTNQKQFISDLDFEEFERYSWNVEWWSFTYC